MKPLLITWIYIGARISSFQLIIMQSKAEVVTFTLKTKKHAVGTRSIERKIISFRKNTSFSIAVQMHKNYDRRNERQKSGTHLFSN
jgi:chlorite dismutase